MPIPSYTPGYPPDGSTLGQTKVIIRNNLDGLFQTLNVDHVNNNGQPGSKPPGYHLIIHEVPQVNVTTVTGFNQIFTGVPGTLVVNSATTPNLPPTGDTQLYSLSSLGILSQLTGSNLTATGYVWCAGLLIQWGKVISTSESFNTQNFNVNFPNNCFGIFTQVLGSGTIPGDKANIDIRNSTITNSSFQWTFVTNSSQYVGFFWIAIGN